MLLKSKTLDKIKGIGPKKQMLLQEMGLYNTYDMINNLPISYKDMRYVSDIAQIQKERSEDIENGQGKGNRLILGRVVSNNSANSAFRKGHHQKNRMIKVTVGDHTGKIQIYFFNTPYVEKILYRGKECYFYGKIKKMVNGFSVMIQPEIIEKNRLQKEIVPVYRLPKGISQKEIINIIKNELNEKIHDPIPENIIENRNLMTYGESLLNIHFPRSVEKYKSAKYRMVYQNLFLMELGIETMRNQNFRGNMIDAQYDAMEKLLPFKLTAAQKNAVEEIRKDMKSGMQMNRLLQGDVGSGKTAVAILALYVTIASGFQGVMMAPTEVLATQHYDSFQGLFKKCGYKTILLKGSMRKREKEEALNSIKSGDAKLILGTHALIQDYVEFDNLGLVITDEQHRFGVNQRIKITEKGKTPHVLVMTATPIPRTLAVLMYGNSDISILDALPSGRKPIITENILKKNRRQMYLNMIHEVKSGRQIYVVASRIHEEDNDEMEDVEMSCFMNQNEDINLETIDKHFDKLKSVEDLYREISQLYKPWGIKVEILHGQMKQEEKEDIMNKFYSGEIHVLISTVIIEVGIDVPNATVMIIEDADRFGLAQLHQLRGRIGRGEHQSYCFLVSDRKGKIANERIDLMCKSNDGFYIAEKDLELRGPGEIFGFRQHGKLDEILNLAIRYKEVMKLAKDDVQSIRGELSDELIFMVKELYNDSEKLNL